MKHNQIEFSLATEMVALAALLAGLNQNGVSYSLTKDSHAVRVTISTGY